MIRYGRRLDVPCLIGESPSKRDGPLAGYSPTNHADLKGIIDRLPGPFLARQVGKMSPAVLDGLYRQLTAEGWSPHRIRRMHSCARCRASSAAMVTPLGSGSLPNSK